MGNARTTGDSTPTPPVAPASEVRALSEGAIPHALERTDLEGALIAAELYGDDDHAELAALVAGTHPFQRHLGDDSLAASSHQVAQIVAVRR